MTPTASRAASIKKALAVLDAELERWIEMGDTRPIASDTALTAGDLRLFHSLLKVMCVQIECPECHGTGGEHILLASIYDADPMEQVVPCDECEGTGKVDWLTQDDVFAAHAQFGRLDWHLVKKAMGPNWPAEWERLGPGEGIFEPEEDRRP